MWRVGARVRPGGVLPRRVPRRREVDARETAVWRSRPRTERVPSRSCSPPDANEYYREVRGEEDGDERFLDAAPCDFFELLGVDTDASADDVKQAFRKLQRVAHPDIAGPTAEPLAVLLQLRVRNPLRRFGARGVSEDSRARAESLRRGSQFDGRPVSEWAGPRDEARAIFVDESTCIGCKSCVLHTPQTRSRWSRTSTRARTMRATVGRRRGDDAGGHRALPRGLHLLGEAQSAPPSPSTSSREQAASAQDIAIMARRRSSNMGSPPSGQNPFTSAEKMLRLRREGKAYVDAAATRAGATAAGGLSRTRPKS